MEPAASPVRIFGTAGVHRSPLTAEVDMAQPSPEPQHVEVADPVPALQFRTIHGYRRAYRIAGSGRPCC